MGRRPRLLTPLESDLWAMRTLKGALSNAQYPDKFEESLESEKRIYGRKHPTWRLSALW